jgi:hypothetical protein
LSDSLVCETKKDFLYVNVVLVIKNHPITLLLPYIYKKDEKNLLNNWIFVNNKFKTSKMEITSFQNIEKSKKLKN